MAQVNTSSLSPLTTAWLISQALEAAQPKLLYGRFAEPYPLAVNQGTTVEWFRYNNPDEVTTAASEGVTPPPISITRTRITASVSQYIWYTDYTDKFENTDRDKKALANLSKKLGQVGARSIDSVDKANFTAGTSVYYAAGVAGRTSVNSVVSEADLDKIIKTLEEDDAEPVESMIDATAKDGTVPIREAFIGIGHTHMRAHLEALPGWKAAETYPDQKSRLPGEIGFAKGIRWCLTSKGAKVNSAGAAVGSGFESTDGVSNNVYQVLIFGKGAFGTVPFMGQNIKSIFKPVGSGGPQDPGDQTGSLAKKTWHASKILDETKVVRYEVCCKINP
jgi:N4-gp56 family major capsid protein